jgi:type VI secretion system protein ImpH
MIEDIARQPARYDLFQAVRLLRRMSRAIKNPVHDLGVRFGAEVNTAFAAAPIAGLDQSEPQQIPRLRVTVMSLAGAGAVLPPPYTEALQRSLRDRQPALRDFLDIFNDRSINLLWRAWARYRPAISAEELRGDQVTEFLLALTGLLDGGRSARLPISDQAVLYLGGHFARRVRPAAGLRAVVASQTGWPVKVEEFRGRWLPLPSQERTHLAPAHAPRHNALGVGAVLGRAVWDVESALGLRIGPVNRAGFQDLMPESPTLRPLIALAGLHAGPAVDLRLQVVCAAEEAPKVLLGRPEPIAPRLGWNIWLGQPQTPVLDDLSYPIGALSSWGKAA